MYRRHNIRLDNDTIATQIFVVCDVCKRLDKVYRWYMRKGKGEVTERDCKFRYRQLIKLSGVGGGLLYIIERHRPHTPKWVVTVAGLPFEYLDSSTRVTQHYIYIYICVCMCVCVCICIYIILTVHEWPKALLSCTDPSYPHTWRGCDCDNDGTSANGIVNNHTRIDIYNIIL